MVDTIEVKEVLERLEIKDEIYQIASNYQLGEDQVDQLLSTDEINSYIASLSEELIHQLIQKQEISKSKIYTFTSTFLDTSKISILSDQLKNQFTSSITDFIYDKLHNIEFDNTVTYSNTIYTIANFNTKILLIIVLIIEIILIVILSWKKKNFFAYFGGVTLFLSITTFLFVFFFKVGCSTIFERQNHMLISLLEPIIASGYWLSMVLFIIMTIFFILHGILKKYIKDYANIPF